MEFQKWLSFNIAARLTLRWPSCNEATTDFRRVSFFWSLKLIWLAHNYHWNWMPIEIMNKSTTLLDSCRLRKGFGNRTAGQMKRLQLQMQMHLSFRIWLDSKCRATQVPLLVNAAWRSLLVVSLKYGGEGNAFEAWELHFASRNSCQLRNHRACEFYFAANFLPTLGSSYCSCSPRIRPSPARCFGLARVSFLTPGSCILQL